MPFPLCPPGKGLILLNVALLGPALLILPEQFIPRLEAAGTSFSFLFFSNILYCPSLHSISMQLRNVQDKPGSWGTLMGRNRDGACAQELSLGTSLVA